MRQPTTADYVRYAKVVAELPDIAAQSTAFIPADVPGQVQDSYRLFLGLMHCAKPVVTGAFSIAGFQVMHDLLLAVRGTAEALRDKPLALFSCAPTTPLSGATSPARTCWIARRRAFRWRFPPCPWPDSPRR